MSTSITIRNLDVQVKQRLRVIAATHGKSMEAEVRDILTQAAFREEKQDVTSDDMPNEGYRSPARGKWKHLGIATDEIMTLTRGE